VLILASRPFEGGLLIVALGTGSALWMRRERAWRNRQLMQRTVAPMLLVITAGLILQAIYNHAVTGSYLVLPYILATRQYHVVPVLWPADMSPPKSYRLDMLRLQFAEWEPLMYREIYRMIAAQRISYLVQRAWDALQGIVPLAFLIPPAFLFWRDRSVRFLLLAGIWGGAALCLETWLYPHYVAAWLPAALLLAFLTLRNLLQVRWRGGRPGAACAAVLLGVAFSAAALRGAVEIHYYVNPEASRLHVGRERNKLANQLIARGGRHVILVRYSPAHNVMQEWVYNGADIDSAPVVWARDRGASQNQRIVAYFQGRAVWLFEPDANPPSLRLYGGE
jgi:hypothetical protein